MTKREKRFGIYMNGISVYLDDFCDKHFIQFDSWINDIGVAVRFNNGYKISFADIRTELDYEMPEPIIWEWYDYKKQHPRAKKELNLYHYYQGHRLKEIETTVANK
jgi:hypothetical protein